MFEKPRLRIIVYSVFKSSAGEISNGAHELYENYIP